MLQDIQAHKNLLAKLIRYNRQVVPKKMECFKIPKRFNFAKGGRGGGKSESYGKILLDMANNRRLRILCAREFLNSIDESVFLLLGDLIRTLEYKNFKILNNKIINTENGSLFSFKGLQGQDKKQTIKSLANYDIVWVEEAQTISKQSLDLLIPTIRKQGSSFWFSFNPILPTDPIIALMESVPLESKHQVEINWMDNPFLPKEFLDEVERQRQESLRLKDDDYDHIYLGKFRNYTNKTIISYFQLQEAICREVQEIGPQSIGVDVARFGNNKTIFVREQNYKVLETYKLAKSDLVNTFNELKAFIDYDKTIDLKVDDTGVGGGLVDLLSHDYYNVTPIFNGGSAKDGERFGNLITEAWYELKKNLYRISIPNDEALIKQLITREYGFDKKGRRMVEPKDDYIKRGFSSPDEADAVLLAMYKPSVYGAFIKL